MLKKLMKHEFRATGRIMPPLLLLVLLLAVGGNIATHNLLETNNGVLNTMGVVLLTAFVIAIMTSFTVSFVLMVQRFYRNLLRDEGYLTMTLPVSVHEHIWAKLLVSLIWWFAVGAVSALALFILVFRLDTLQWIGELLSHLRFASLPLDSLPHMLLFCLELVLLTVLVGACICLHFYAAMSVGHSFTHHKEALSVAAFFALSMLLSFLQRIVMLGANLLPLDSLNAWLQGMSGPAPMHMALLAASASMAIWAAIYYAITAYFLRNRLNLG